VTESIASPTPSISVEAAIAKAEDTLSGSYNGQPASIQYLVKSDGSAALTHVMQIQNEEAGTWFDAFVDAHSGELLHVTDFVSKASVRDISLSSGHKL
jgi:extracellular elastinolytic metalloproteinase